MDRFCMAENSLGSTDNAGFSVVRISRDGEFALAKNDAGIFRVYGLGSKTSLISESSDLLELTVESGWRRAASEEVEALTASIVYDEDGDPIGTDLEEEDVATPFRAPQAVRETIIMAMQALGDEMGTHDAAVAERIAYADGVSVADVQWIANFFETVSNNVNLHGGFKGQKWAEKILGAPEDQPVDLDEDGGSFDYEPYAKYDFAGSNLKFYGCGQHEGLTLCDALIGIDYDEMCIYVWDHGFEPLTQSELDAFEAPAVILIDPDTASFLAKALDTNPNDPVNILDTCPEERNLFDMAEPDLDYDEMDRLFSIIADATGYSPSERSHNAKRQMRNTGGMFDGAQIEEEERLGSGYKKATIKDNPPIISDAKARIDQFLEKAVKSHSSASALTADAGDSQITSMPDPDPSLPPQSGTDNKLEGEAAEPNGSVMYFAIVDPNDSTAVLELVAITKNGEGKPEAWTRQKGQWVIDQKTLDQLQSATPPPVVELDAPEPALSVIKQVDEHGDKAGTFPTDAVPGTTASIMDAEDLVSSVERFSSLDESEQVMAKHYIRRRARALNRMDLIPREWREFDATEASLVESETADFFGPRGEVLTAAGGSHGRLHGNAAQLKRYWTVGPGAAKIMWGTPGDLTRAHSHLAKFVGPDRAWGLAQTYHEAVFHMSNTKHDKLTGQYVSHKK